ncbi:hypothetical protein D3C72_2458050 [compost metagenome]
MAGLLKLPQFLLHLGKSGILLLIVSLQRTDYRFPVSIQQPEVTLGLQQVLVLMLAVNVDQLFSDFPQHAEIDHLSVNT